MHFSLVMKLNDGTERKFPLRQDKTLIGRETRCHVRIALPNVAERHCELTLDDGKLKLRDLGSELGTLVNGSPVRKTVLGPRDELTVGPVTFQVERDRPPEPSDASLSPAVEIADNTGYDAARPAASSEIEVTMPDADPTAAKSRSRNSARNTFNRRDR